MKKILSSLLLAVLVVTLTSPAFAAINPATQIQGVSGTPSGTGALCLKTNCAMVTPDLGTPSALVGTNITGTAAGFTAQNAVNATNAVNVTGTIASGVVATTQTIADNSTKVATTAFVAANAGDFISIVANSGAGALTFNVAAGQRFKFRSSTLTDGVPVPLANASVLSVIAPSGATLGATSTVSARVYMAVFNDGGTLRLAVINATSVSVLDEDELSTTTAMSAGATALNTWYSTVAITSPAPYRIVGFVEAVNTAGDWASPTTVQPGGGLALAIPIAQLSLFGTINSATGHTVGGGTYTNNSTKPMFLSVTGTTNSTALVLTLNINGSFDSEQTASANTKNTLSSIIPAGATYAVTQTGTTFTQTSWIEKY